MLLAYAVQDIGSNEYVPPAGLATVGVSNNGGQQVGMIIFSKDRTFAGQTPSYVVGTSQTDSPATGGVVVIKPQ